MNDNAKVLAAVLAGLVAGVVIGVLLAPDKGAETRDKLNESLKSLGDTIKDRLASEVEKISKKDKQSSL